MTTRSQALRYKYGITDEQYREMLREQDGRCAVCRQRPPSGGAHQNRVLQVDHHHATGEVRGLLCNKCNMAAGFLDDDADRAFALGNYLTEPYSSSRLDSDEIDPYEMVPWR